MRKTYFEAPELEFVKVQTMQLLVASGEPVEQGGDDEPAGSRSFYGGIDEDGSED